MTEELTRPVHSLRDATGVSQAKLLEFKLYHKPKKQSPAQRIGIRYEKRTLKHLSLELPESVLSHPAFEFRRGALKEYAIPDAIYRVGNTLTIFEIKLKHTADAWFQLNKLYRPIIAAAYPGISINLCEVCRDYDPRVRLASRTEIIENLISWTQAPRTDYGVYIYTGRTC